MSEFAFKAHPGPQEIFLGDESDFVLYGGSRGGGKSLSLAWDAAYKVRKSHWEFKGKEISEKVAKEIQKLPDSKQVGLEYVVDKVSIDYPEYQALLVRRTYPQLLRNIKPETDKLYPAYGGKWMERDHCYIFPSGAKIYLVHCADIRALDNYIGGNFHYIGIDEANTFPEDWVERILSSARSTNPEIKVFRRLTANPGNIGHSWLKKKYIERCPPILDGSKIYSEEYEVFYQKKKPGVAYIDDGLSYKFIPATVFDNPSITENDPAYVKFLKGLPELLRAMWLYGEWDAFSGQFFDNWNPYYHVIPEEEFKFGSDWSRVEYTLVRGYDEGTKAPFVCLLGAVNSLGEIVIFDEIFGTGYAASEQAKYVNQETKERWGFTPDDFDEEIADPAYWTKKSEKDGMLYSPADFYADEGIDLTPGNNDRKAGAKLFYNALALPEGIEDVLSASDQWNTSDIRPKLRFTSNCTYCTESIPNLPAKETDPEDVDTKADDHPFDAGKYLIMAVLGHSEPKKVVKKGWMDTLGGDNLDGNESGGTWKSV
jgi:hypothetical protein